MSFASSKTLVAITTFNHCEYTRRCLETLMGVSQEVKVYDDCSTDGTRELCQEFKIPFLSNRRPQGLTSLWNQAYREFVDRNYEYLIISNNDVLFPRGALDQFEQDLEQHAYVGVLTRLNDSVLAEHQAVEKIMGLSKDVVDQPEKFQFVQDQLLRLELAPLSYPLGLWLLFWFITKSYSLFIFTWSFGQSTIDQRRTRG